jgi:hypothetical protein
MQCNIDAFGKRIRLISGLVVTGIGLVVGGLTAAGVLPAWGWWPTLGLLLGGGFMIFEARAGWCAVRAMGVKTPW